MDIKMDIVIISSFDCGIYIIQKIIGHKNHVVNQSTVEISQTCVAGKLLIASNGYLLLMPNTS